MSERQGRFNAGNRTLPDMNLGEILRVTLKRAKVTQRDAGTHLGIGGSHMSEVLSGERAIPEDKVPVLIDYLSSRFDDPDELKQLLEEAFKREQLVRQISDKISLVLQRTQSGDQLSELNQLLSTHEGRDSFVQSLNALREDLHS